MPVLLPQAIEKFAATGNARMVGIGKSIVTFDQMSLRLPFMGVAGQGLSYEREGVLPTGGAFIDDSGTTSEESGGRPDYVHTPFRRIVGNVDVDNLLNAFTGGAEQASQSVRKTKATWRTVQQTNVNGNYVTSHTLSVPGAPMTALASFGYGPGLDSNRFGMGRIKYTHSTTSWQFQAPGDIAYGDAVVVASGTPTVVLKSFNTSKWIRVTITAATATANGETNITFVSTTNAYDGMYTLCPTSQVITPVDGTNGDAFDLKVMDDLQAYVKVGDASNRAYIMNMKMFNKLKAARRALGGTTPEHTVINGVSVPVYDGIPIFVNDFLPNETYASNTCSSILLTCMSADEGLFMGVANANGDNFDVDTDVTKRPLLGFQLDNLGNLEAKDATRLRVKFYGALGLRSELAIARRQGIITG